MMSETDMADRVRRARTENMEAHVVSEDPLVVEVENHDSEDGDAVHTVLPENLYCGCWDHRARVTLCKHLIFLALGEDDSVTEEVRTVTRNAITDELREMQDEEMELRARLREIAEERERMESVRQEMPMRDYFPESDDEGKASGSSGAEYGLGGSPGMTDAEVEAELDEIDAEEIVQELEEEGPMSGEELADAVDADDEDDFRSMVEDLSE